MTGRTSKEGPVRIGIIGCGMIAGPYVRSLRPFPQVELAGVASRTYAKCSVFAGENDLRAYESVAALLSDDTIEMVLDLSGQDAHASVVASCLDAGKHVYCEKPLALSYAQAAELAARAKAAGLRLGSAPSTFMGEAQQTAAKVIREGRLGKVRLVYAEINHGRVETWHASAPSFYRCGPLFDMGPYALILLTSIFGPAARVQAFGRYLLPERRTTDGTAFTLEKPDFVLALVEFRDGPLARLSINYYADWWKKEGELVEFHGDEGSLCLGHVSVFGAPVEYAEYGKRYEAVTPVREPFQGIEWGRGVVDMAAALREGRPHRASGEQAAHIVEIMCAIEESAAANKAVDVKSTFPAPAPMEWAL
jgi:predicted dehydrogenase